MLGTETWGLKDWLEAGSYAVAILLFIGAPLTWYIRRNLEARRTDTPTAASNEVNEIDYADSGRHGVNLLSHAFESVQLKDPVSMRAVIPQGRELRVRLIGPKPEFLDQTEAAWYYQMSPINWTGGKYSESLGETFPVQTFTAEAGTADLQITFHRRGIVTIEAYEGKEREPSWTKQIRVTV